MRSLKKAFLLLMALVVLTTALYGCGQTPGEPTGGTQQPPTSSPATAAPQEPEEPVEISIWVSGGRYTEEDRRDKISREQDYGLLEEMFNIILDYTIVPSEEVRDQVGILLATNSMTDIMQLPGSYDTFLVRPDQMFADGQIIDLKTIESSIPDYMQLINDNPVMLKNVMNDDENIMYFGRPLFEQEIGMSGGLMIRKDWLDKFDLELPQSLDELIHALETFRDGDPNGNGEKDEVPFCGNQGSLQVIGNLTGIQETFSMVGGPAGEVVFGPFEEAAYQKRLKLIATFAQGKLINENYYNFDFQMRDTWMVEDRVGASLTGLGNLDKWNGWMDDHETFLMWPIDNPAMEDGNRYFDRTGMTKGMGDTITVISTNAENPEKCGELVNYFYTEEGHMLTTFGVEGITYEMAGTLPKYTDLIVNNPDDLGVGDAQGKYIGIPGMPTYDDMRVWAQLSLTSPAARQANIHTWTDTFTIETNTPIPPAMMDTDSADEYADIMADLQTYLLESVAKFTTGEWDIDADYAQFVQTCRDLKAERALELLTDAVKAWQNRGGVPYEYTLQRAQIDYWSEIPLATEKGLELMDPSLK
jgi:putative aldouronate transport system substrate-binding protein